MDNQTQKLQIISLVRLALIIMGLVLMVVYGAQAAAQATSWQAVAGTQF